ncbi:MAG: hypothetical protein ACLPUO_18245 [Streptosporangiaceae bacterium]
MSKDSRTCALGRSADLGRGAPWPADAAPQTDRRAKVLGWSAAAGLSSSLLLLVAASAVRNSWSRPRIGLPPAGPPWEFALHPPASLTTVTLILWAAAVIGAAGVAAGLAAVARGARPPVRALIAASVVATAVLTVLPPAGSTDALDYAVYGRIVLLGHSPYGMTPQQLRLTGDPVGLAAPHQWRNHVSVYGPAATAEQWAAAELGGSSITRIVFWLKLWDALAFLAVMLALDRLLRAHPARRARAHLLWSANPLLLWCLMAAGHIDVLAAALGFLGLIALGEQARSGTPRLFRVLAAGALVGLAADLKITYLLFAAGIAWAARRSPAALAGAAAAVLAVLAPSYLWFGRPAVRALLARSEKATIDSFYRLLRVPMKPGIVLLLLAGLALVVVAALLVRRLPDGITGRPAIHVALALSIAWLFVWPYQLPWYDTMAICLLALYPASRLDWLVLLRLAAGALAVLPGTGRLDQMAALAGATRALHLAITPALMLAAVAGLIWLCVSGAWNMGPGFALPGVPLAQARAPNAKASRDAAV